MTEVSRRTFLGRAGVAAGGVTIGGASLGLLAGCTDSAGTRADDQNAVPLDLQDWDSVRAQFALRTDRMHFSAWGLALVYGGLRLRPDDEVLSSEHDFYSTQEALRLSAEHSGATLRKISLYESPSQASVDEIVSRIVAAITPRTRVLALTWVHSGMGVKLPIAAAAAAAAAAALGSRCHPTAVLRRRRARLRGREPDTGGTRLRRPGRRCAQVAVRAPWHGHRLGQAARVGTDHADHPVLRPGVARFLDPRRRVRVPDPGRGQLAGRFQGLEYRWALTQAFEFMTEIGPDRVASYTHHQVQQLMAGLDAIDGVHVVTPQARGLHAGLVCIQVAGGRSPFALAERLLERNSIVSGATPYRLPYLRLGPSIVTNPDQVDRVISAVADLL